jgi:hypothetical protein
MASRQGTDSLIRSAFPGHDSLIERAFRENRAFRELCQDYRACAVALERWRRLQGEEPSSRAREYAELLAQLGSEIASWIEGMESVSTPLRPGGPR